MEILLIEVLDPAAPGLPDPTPPELITTALAAPGPIPPRPIPMGPIPMGPTVPERTAAIRRAAARLCLFHGWSPLHEVPLPNSRRADILALRPDGGFTCIEVKSGARDYLSDAKWPEYREFCDELFFAVDADFPLPLLPDDVGVIVTDGREAAVLRDAPAHRLPATRRRALLTRFAFLAAGRLAAMEDPGAMTDLRHALAAE